MIWPPTASQLAMQALNLPVSETFKAQCRPIVAPGRCTFCGVPLPIGEYVVAKPYGDSFMDDLSLAARTNLACAACYTIAGKGCKDILTALLTVVVTADGVYPIRKDCHRTWFLLTPPEPPFVAMIGLTKSQHLAWRTPVTLDKRLITVRLGEELVTIRHPYLLQAVAVCHRAAARLNAHETTRKKAGKTWSHPFAFLDREAKVPDHGLFHDKARALAGLDSELAADLDFLAGCTKGELWALATLVKSTPEAPERPDLETSLKPKKENQP